MIRSSLPQTRPRRRGMRWQQLRNQPLQLNDGAYVSIIPSDRSKYSA